MNATVKEIAESIKQTTGKEWLSRSDVMLFFGWTSPTTASLFLANIPKMGNTKGSKWWHMDIAAEARRKLK